jgi:trypsin
VGGNFLSIRSVKDGTILQANVGYQQTMIKFPASSAFLLLFTSATNHVAVEASTSTTTTTDSKIILGPSAALVPLNNETHGDIVGGVDAERGEFPYYAHPAGDGVCGGALIATNIILTAAHCSSLYKKGDYPWIVGSTDVLFTDDIDAEFQESIEQESFSIHPDYNSFTFENDYAVIVLQAEFTNNNVGFIVPAGKNYQDVVNQRFVVMGRGLTREGGALAENMQKATVVNVDIDSCAEDYEGQLDIVPESMICAASNGIDSCGGDSGGPMVDDDNAIVGIVSFGIGCADPDYPGVYSRVSGGWEWINEQVCDGAISIPDWADCPAGRDEVQGCNNMSRWEWIQCMLGV